MWKWNIDRKWSPTRIFVFSLVSDHDWCMVGSEWKDEEGERQSSKDPRVLSKSVINNIDLDKQKERFGVGEDLSFSF